MLLDDGIRWISRPTDQRNGQTFYRLLTHEKERRSSAQDLPTQQVWKTFRSKVSSLKDADRVLLSSFHVGQT